MRHVGSAASENQQLRSHSQTSVISVAKGTSLLPDCKGPAPVNRVLQFDAGRLIIGGLVDGLESQCGTVRRSLEGLTQDIGGMTITAPSVSDFAKATEGVGSRLSTPIDSPDVESAEVRVLNYYAAENSSLSSEEELFKATGTARIVGW